MDGYSPESIYYPASQIPSLQSFKQAEEEAKEILARRDGLTPATQHEPLDFLNPPKGASIAVKELEKGWLLNPPEPLTQSLAASIRPEQILQKLHSIARSPNPGVDRVRLLGRRGGWGLVGWEASTSLNMTGSHLLV